MTKDEFKNCRDTLSRQFYVYVLSANGVPFYVGKGNRNVRWSCQHRALAHEKDARSGSDSACARHIRNLWRQGDKVQYNLHFDTNSEWLALYEEQVLIGKHRRLAEGGTLVNQTSGGQGMSGFTLSKKTRSRMSKSRIGRSLSTRHRKAISEGRLTSARVAADNERRRKPVIVEHRQFSSVVEASRMLSIPTATIHYRLQTHKPGYKHQ